MRVSRSCASPTSNDLGSDMNLTISRISASASLIASPYHHSQSELAVALVRQPLDLAALHVVHRGVDARVRVPPQDRRANLARPRGAPEGVQEHEDQPLR